MECEYGCGSKALFKLRNGKFCCNSNVSKCIAIIEKISNTKKQKTIKVKMPTSECQFCKEHFGTNIIDRHIEKCYLNQKNLRLCPVCETPIKGKSVTCSKNCSNKIFKTGPKSSTFKGKKYTNICYHYNEKKCVVCDEKNIVEVHHLDLDHNNNKPDNLIPLCPTHHSYLHFGFDNLIKDQIDKWKKEIKLLITKFDRMDQLELFNFKKKDK